MPALQEIQNTLQDHENQESLSNVQSETSAKVDNTPVVSEVEDLDQNPPLVNENKTLKVKGKGTRKEKTEKSMKHPSKKRKIQVDQSDTENDENELKLKTNTRGRKKGESAEAWTEDEDKILMDIMKQNMNGSLEGSVPWKLVVPEYQKLHPERSMVACRNRWLYHLKNGNTELNEEEIERFKKAVEDIKGPEKNAAIAWRYKELGGSAMNKGAVAKLLKQLDLK